MARLAKILRERKVKKLVKKYAIKRDLLRSVIKDPEMSWDEKKAAQRSIQKLPTNSCKCRLRNRCEATGRPRGYIRKFGLSRTPVRNMMNEGLFPGLHKASW